MSILLEKNELTIETAVANWIPECGQTFYAPDILGERKPVETFTWRGSSSDMRLLASKLVFKTREAAMKRYVHIMALLAFVDN